MNIYGQRPITAKMGLNLGKPKKPASGSAPVNTNVPVISGSGTLTYASTPTFAILDNFNRANENPLSQGGTWTTVGELPALSVVNNQVLATASFAGAYRGSYTDVEVAVKLGTIAATANSIQLRVRMTDAGGVSPIRASHNSSYSFGFSGKTGYSITKWIDGVATTIKANTAWSGGTLSDGDYIGARALGTILEVWCKRGAGSWTKEFTTTDSTHTTGAVCLIQESTTSTLDDFAAQEAVSTLTYGSGTTLSTTTGSWTGNPTPTYSYAWLRCDSAGANCVVIPSATFSSYTLTSSDVNSTIRSRVTATNTLGAVNAQSSATGTITTGSPSGTVQFLGDFESGTLDDGKWFVADELHGVSDPNYNHGRAYIVTSPVGSGTYAVRMDLDADATKRGRVDLVTPQAGTYPIILGQDVYFAHEFYLPSNWSQTASDFVIGQYLGQQPNIWAVPILLSATQDGLRAIMQTGITADPTGSQYNNGGSPTGGMPVTWAITSPNMNKQVWHQIIIRVTVAVDSTGIFKFDDADVAKRLGIRQ